MDLGEASSELRSGTRTQREGDPLGLDQRGRCGLRFRGLERLGAIAEEAAELDGVPQPAEERLALRQAGARGLEFARGGVARAQGAQPEAQEGTVTDVASRDDRSFEVGAGVLSPAEGLEQPTQVSEPETLGPAIAGLSRQRECLFVLDASVLEPALRAQDEAEVAEHDALAAAIGDLASDGEGLFAVGTGVVQPTLQPAERAEVPERVAVSGC